MRKYSLGSIALIAGAAAMLLGNVPAARAAAGDHLLAVGVVNTTQILRSMQETRKFETDFRAKDADLAQQQHQRELKIQEMANHRDQNLKPGSPQWQAATDELDKETADLDVWEKLSALQLDRFRKQSIKGFYDHIAQAAAQVAHDQHLDLIIADQLPEIGPDMDKANVNQLQAALASRAVLFSDKKADITEDVLTVVEANFANANPAGPAPAPSPAPAK